MEEALSFLQLAGLTLIGSALYIWWQGRAIDRGCKECYHCNARILEKAKKAHRDWHSHMHVPRDATQCNRCREWGEKD